MLRISTLLFAFAITISSFAQKATPQEKHYKTVEKFIQGYNEQNYKKMHKPFSFLAGAIISKGRLKKGFGSQYKTYGKATYTIATPTAYRATMHLVFEKDSLYVINMTFGFNGRSKISGFSTKIDYYNYPAVPPAANVEQAIDTVLKKTYPNGFNGQVLYAEGQNIVFKKNYGKANFATGEQFNDSTMFELASVSKQFTAAAIMKLEEQGKLTVTDSLKKFFPQLPYNITIEQILHHTSGLADYMGPLMKKSVKKEFCTNDDIIAWLAKDKPKLGFTPGERFDYSNTGYAVLASVVEKASGMSYADYLKTNFFEPLHMTHTRVYCTRRVKKEILPNYAFGYVYDSKAKTYALPDSVKDYAPVVTKLDGIYGDGTVNSTALDLVKWSRGLNAHTVLSAASLDKAYTPGKLNSGKATDYGYGVEFHANDKTGRIITHTGGWPGYQTMITRFVDQDKVLIILCNEETPDANILFAGKKMMTVFLSRKDQRAQKSN